MNGIIARFAVVIGLAGAFVATAASFAPVSAQIERLPATSRAEGQANAINNSLANQSMNRSVTQQNQFEINSLRTQNQVQSVVPPPSVTAPPTVGVTR